MSFLSNFALVCGRLYKSDLQIHLVLYVYTYCYGTLCRCLFSACLSQFRVVPYMTQGRSSLLTVHSLGRQLYKLGLDEITRSSTVTNVYFIVMAFQKWRC